MTNMLIITNYCFDVAYSVKNIISIP